MKIWNISCKNSLQIWIWSESVNKNDVIQLKNQINEKGS